mmetsp:Transcript_7053/g.12351  ORF Transcript_7053/g.12351 Transcript_7053/m.12351 type:complete len:278 (-) Transcript_7053:518-1351(-)
MDLLHDGAVKSIGEYAGKFYGAEAYIRFAQTCKRMKQLLLPDPTNSLSDDGENQTDRNVIRARLANYCQSHPEAPSSILGSGSNGINTLEQLAVFEKWSVTNYFIHDNRITFPFATTEIEPAMLDRILKIVDIMKQHPRVSVRLDSHCGTLAPSGISSWFSRARGLRVQNAICDTTNNMGMGTNDNNRHSPIDQSRVNVVAWGKRISTVVARSSDHPFRVDAREGRGWVELYLEVPGSREGDEIMVFPPRQQYYDDVGSSSDSDEDLFVDDDGDEDY